MKVPLGYRCCCCGALDAGEDAEGPEVDEDEKYSKGPCAAVDDEEVLCVGEVAAKEDAREHCHPEPGPDDHAGEGAKAY